MKLPKFQVIEYDDKMNKINNEIIDYYFNSNNWIMVKRANGTFYTVSWNSNERVEYPAGTKILIPNQTGNTIISNNCITGDSFNYSILSNNEFDKLKSLEYCSEHFILNYHFNTSDQYTLDDVVKFISDVETKVKATADYYFNDNGYNIWFPNIITTSTNQTKLLKDSKLSNYWSNYKIQIPNDLNNVDGITRITRPLPTNIWNPNGDDYIVYNPIEIKPLSRKSFSAQIPLPTTDSNVVYVNKNLINRPVIVPTLKTNMTEECEEKSKTEYNLIITDKEAMKKIIELNEQLNIQLTISVKANKETMMSIIQQLPQ